MSGCECRVCGYYHPGEGCVVDDALVGKLARERDEARAEVERLNTECDSLAHQLNRCNERGGQMRRLLVWAEALIRSLSGWPEHHPSEVVDWKEDWRKVREGK